MEESGHLSVRLIRPLFLGLQAMGRDASALLSRAGIDIALMSEGSAWVPQRAVLEFWKLAEQSSPPQMGLRLLEGIDFAQFAYLGASTEFLLLQLLVRSETVANALDMFERYAPTTFDQMPWAIERDTAGWLMRLKAHDLPMEFVNFAATYPLRAIQQATTQPLGPPALFFPYPEPADLSTHRRVFRDATLHFNAEYPGFRIAAEDLLTRMKNADARFVLELRSRADRAVAERKRQGTLTGQIQDLLRTDLREGTLSAELLSQRLGVSVRTLTRKLGGEGTTLREVIDDLRATKARELLLMREPPPLERIAAEVGFSDTTAFQRAFRRWFGTTPGQFRSERGDAPEES